MECDVDGLVRVRLSAYVLYRTLNTMFLQILPSRIYFGAEELEAENACQYWQGFARHVSRSSTASDQSNLARIA